MQLFHCVRKIKPKIASEVEYLKISSETDSIKVGGKQIFNQTIQHSKHDPALWGSSKLMQHSGEDGVVVWPRPGYRMDLSYSQHGRWAPEQPGCCSTDEATSEWHTLMLAIMISRHWRSPAALIAIFPDTPLHWYKWASFNTTVTFSAWGH